MLENLGPQGASVALKDPHLGQSPPVAPAHRTANAPVGSKAVSSLDGSVPDDGRPHAIVIGSGFGGLAAAVRLGVRGYRVTVLEKLDAPGGRAYV